MNSWVYVYIEESEDYMKITDKEMLEMKQNPSLKIKYISYKSNLYWSKSKNQKMVFVSKGNIGFRKYPKNSSNNFYYRGENESMTHKGYKEAIASLKEIKMIIGDEEVIASIDNAELEKEVICNGRHYKCDVVLKISKIQPTDYIDKLGDYLYLEIYHTCSVDSRQANDFEAEGLTLLEYTIPRNREIYNNVSESGFEKQKKYIVNDIQKNGMKNLIVYCQSRISIAKWKICNKKKETYSANILGLQFTVMKSQINNKYLVIYSYKNKTIYKEMYNQKSIDSIVEAKKIAEIIAIKLHNKQEID